MTYQPPICDRCGKPINWAEEMNDDGPLYRFQILEESGAPVGYDLHKKCSREVKAEYDKLVKRGAMNPELLQ